MELYFLAFVVYASISILWGKYNPAHDLVASIKTFVPIAVTFFFSKFLFESLEKKDIEDILFTTGYFLIILQILSHFIGLYFSQNGNSVPILNEIFLENHLPRLQGIFGNPNWTPFYISLFYFFFLVNRKKSILHFIGLLLIGWLIIITQSRTAIISIFLGTLANSLYENQRKKYFLGVLGAFLLGIITLIPINNYLSEGSPRNLSPQTISNFIQKITKNDRFTLESVKIRMKLWNSSFEAFLKHPFIGIGYENSPFYNQIETGYKYLPHQIFLQILTEMGVMGFFIFTLIYLEFFKCLKALPKFFILFQIYYILSGLSECFLLLPPLVISFSIAFKLKKADLIPKTSLTRKYQFKSGLIVFKPFWNSARLIYKRTSMFF